MIFYNVAFIIRLNDLLSKYGIAIADKGVVLKMFKTRKSFATKTF